MVIKTNDYEFNTCFSAIVTVITVSNIISVAIVYGFIIDNQIVATIIVIFVVVVIIVIFIIGIVSVFVIDI